MGQNLRMAPGKKARSYLKNNKKQKVALAVEHLPSKLEALSSKPQHHQKKKITNILKTINAIILSFSLI
jgi:hypothetical protein